MGRRAGRGARVSISFFKESNSKKRRKKFIVSGVEGEGATGSDFFFTKDPNLKIFLLLCGWGGGGIGVGGSGRLEL